MKVIWETRRVNQLGKRNKFSYNFKVPLELNGCVLFPTTFSSLGIAQNI